MATLALRYGAFRQAATSPTGRLGHSRARLRLANAPERRRWRPAMPQRRARSVADVGQRLGMRRRAQARLTAEQLLEAVVGRVLVHLSERGDAERSLDEE